MQREEPDEDGDHEPAHLGEGARRHHHHDEEDVEGCPYKHEGQSFEDRFEDVVAAVGLKALEDRLSLLEDVLDPVLFNALIRVEIVFVNISHAEIIALSSP